MNSPDHSTAARNLKPCRYYSQGQCRNGDKCKYSHDADVQLAGKDAELDSISSDPKLNFLSDDASDASPRLKRGQIPCRFLKAGDCARGSKCWYNHDIDKPSRKQKGPSSLLADSQSEELNLLKAEHIRVQEVEAAAAARERANAIARVGASKTITQVVSGSIVTYSAGLDISNLVTGFQTCTLRIGNLPPDVKEHDIHALLMGYDLDARHYHLAIKKKPDGRHEAHVVTDEASGRLALGLDGVEFQEEALVVEMSATSSLDGMSATGGQNPETLTISWRAPSARYIAEYVNAATANAKVKKLHHFYYDGRRIKVQMNTPPPGRFVHNWPRNSIKINNLPPSVTDEEVIRLTGATSVKRLPIGDYTVEQVAKSVRKDIELALPGGLKKFEDPPSSCTPDGFVFTQAHFSTWDEAHTAHTRLSDKRYFNQPIRLQLYDPMYFTLLIPAEQYKAQKAQWDALTNSIKDKKACTLSVRDCDNFVRIRLSGSVKEATGALKVRVENLARGEKVEGWHRSLGIPGNPFVSRVYSKTGACLRADWKRQSLKVYGRSRAVEQAREMIKRELDRLAALDVTVVLARRSVGFFVREGIQQLKETLGENNVRFVTSSRKITVSGGEEARHALDRLIKLSANKRTPGLPNASQGSQTCPICSDVISSPHQLGCGHTYCYACLHHLISSAVESDQLPLTCLGDEARCRVPIAIPTIQLFLPPTSFNRLLEVAFDAYIAKHPEVFKHCETPDCPQIYRAVQAGAAPKTIHCPSCFSAVCNGCHEDAHGGLSCARARRKRAEQERLNDGWIASQNGRVKRCPQCNTPIEVSEGCNHIICRCGAHICWQCMEIFTAETIRTHMRTVHVTTHGIAPAVRRVRQPVDARRPVQRQSLKEQQQQQHDGGCGCTIM